MKTLTHRRLLFIILLVASIVGTLVICLVMNLVLIPAIEAGDAPMRCFDMCTTGYTPQDAHAFVNWLSPDALHAYLHVQLPLDFFYPICYTVMFVLLWIALHGKPNWMLALPAALCVADYVENSLVIVMLRHPDFSNAVVRVASWATMIKTALMYLIFVLWAIAGVVCLVRWLRMRSQRKQAEEDAKAASAGGATDATK